MPDYPYPDWLTDNAIVRRAVREEHDAMLPHGSGTITEIRAAHHLSKVAARAYAEGRHDALAELRTSREVAEELGITVKAVHDAAKTYGVGWEIGRDRLFRPEDVAVLRTRRTTPGPRPKRAEGQ